MKFSENHPKICANLILHNNGLNIDNVSLSILRNYDH